MDYLPEDPLILIISFLDRHNILLINRVSKIFANLCQSNYYRNLLITMIQKDMNLDFNKYSLDQLKNIFLMTKQSRFDDEMILNDKNVYMININQNTIHLLLNGCNIIQINKYALDNEGYIYHLRHTNTKLYFEKDFSNNNVIKLLGGYFYQNNHNRIIHYDYLDGRKPTVHPNLENNHIIKCNNYHLNNKGAIYGINGVLDDSRCYTQVSRQIFLDDNGYLYKIIDGEIKLIPNIDNIIQFAYAYESCIILNNKGRVSYINVTNNDIIKLDINNIVDISKTSDFDFLALNCHNQVHVIKFSFDNLRRQMDNFVEITTLNF